MYVLSNLSDITIIMSVYELKTSIQWRINLIHTLNNIFNKLSDKIEDVNTNIIAFFHMEILYVDICKFVTCSMNIL